MPIPTEMVGSLPRPMKLQEAYEAHDQGQITFEQLQAEQDKAAEDSIKRLEETGQDVVTDGEQRESSFGPIRSRTRWRAPAWPTTSPGTASSSRSSTTATTGSCRA